VVGVGVSKDRVADIDRNQPGELRRERGLYTVGGTVHMPRGIDGHSIRSKCAL
jgi:hypothetical protein